jgi:hypothetical protein
MATYMYCTYHNFPYYESQPTQIPERNSNLNQESLFIPFFVPMMLEFYNTELNLYIFKYFAPIFEILKAVLRIRDILVLIRILLFSSVTFKTATFFCKILSF